MNEALGEDLRASGKLHRESERKWSTKALVMFSGDIVYLAVFRGASQEVVTGIQLEQEASIMSEDVFFE